MSNKSPGRGLMDISDVFLSNKSNALPNEKKIDPPAPPPSSEPYTHCNTCIHFISACTEPTCRIFTFDFEQYGVPYMAEIDPFRASSCRYYQSPKKNQEPTGSSSADGVEIEDTLKLTRKMAIRKNGFTQKNFRRILFDHLEEGYDIKRIIMEKRCDKKARQTQNIIHTKVDVFIEE